MNIKSRWLTLGLCSSIILSPAQAQWVVDDPGVETEEGLVVEQLMQANGTLNGINGELGTANRTLSAIETATQNTYDTLTTPTPITAGLAALDGGTGKEITSATTNFVQDTSGESATTTEAKLLETREEAGRKANAAKGLVSGNTQGALAEQELNTLKNIESRAEKVINTADSQNVALDAVQGRLDALTSIHSVMVWGDSLLVRLIKTADFLSVAEAEGTTATAEAALKDTRQYLQIEDDRDSTAKAFLAGAATAAAAIGVGATATI